MGILSKIVGVIVSIIKKIVKAIVDFIKKYWWVILIVAAIYFAPALGAFFTTNGAGFLGSFFTTIGTTITPTVTSALAWLWDGAAALGSSAWTAFKGLELGTQLAIVGGAAALVAPEETADLLNTVGDVAGDLLGGTISGVLGAVPGIVWVVAGALGLWWLFGSSSTDRQQDQEIAHG